MVLFGIYYIPIDGPGGLGPMRISLMIFASVVFILFTFKITKALIIGILYLTVQYIVASFHPESFRLSTYLYSVLLVLTYICMYNLIYVERVFTIDFFLKIIRWMILAYFIVCVIQQVIIVVGVKTLPAINLPRYFDRGIGCNSLSMEPSTFARFMLVFYYAYIKCHEYIRGAGPFKLKELFSKEHRLITLSFLWMMCTMGSGTAFICLMLLALYFIRRNNWYYILPSLLGFYFLLLPLLNFEQLNRAVAVAEAMTTMDQQTVEEADGSGASRISPFLNSFKVDLTQKETWFGHGIDYAKNNNMINLQTATLFDDYGLLFYIVALVFNLSCAYRFRSLGFIFMLSGVAGGAGGNIHYAWELMIVMTCVRYFYENRNNLEFDEELLDEDKNETEVQNIKN